MKFVYIARFIAFYRKKSMTNSITLSLLHLVSISRKVRLQPVDIGCAGA